MMIRNTPDHQLDGGWWQKQSLSAPCRATQSPHRWTLRFVREIFLRENLEYVLICAEHCALWERDLFEREPWICADSPHSKLAHLGWVWSTLRWRVIKESSWILEKMIETLLQEAAWCQGSSQDRKQKSCLPCFSQIMICFTFCKKKSLVHV